MVKSTMMLKMLLSGAIICCSGIQVSDIYPAGSTQQAKLDIDRDWFKEAFRKNIGKTSDIFRCAIEMALNDLDKHMNEERDSDAELLDQVQNAHVKKAMPGLSDKLSAISKTIIDTSNSVYLHLKETYKELREKLDKEKEDMDKNYKRVNWLKEKKKKKNFYEQSFDIYNNMFDMVHRHMESSRVTKREYLKTCSESKRVHAVKYFARSEQLT